MIIPLPKSRSRCNMRDGFGRKVSAAEMYDLVVCKLCYLSGAYDNMSNERCLDIWNAYHYGDSLFGGFDEKKDY